MSNFKKKEIKRKREFIVEEFVSSSDFNRKKVWIKRKAENVIYSLENSYLKTGVIDKYDSFYVSPDFYLSDDELKENMLDYFSPLYSSIRSDISWYYINYLRENGFIVSSYGYDEIYVFLKRRYKIIFYFRFFIDNILCTPFGIGFMLSFLLTLLVLLK